MSRLFEGYCAQWDLLAREGTPHTATERAVILDIDNRRVVVGFTTGMAAGVLQFPFVLDVTGAIEAWLTRMQEKKV
jgi:hypothetical protein